MINLRVRILWLLCHAVGVPPCFGQTNVRLEPTTLQGRCPGEVVTLTCTTTGSAIIAWRSEEYIGTGVTQLELARVNNVGHTVRSDLHPDSVYATLTDKSLDHLTSTLTISLLPAIQRSTVTCVNVGNGEVEISTIGLLDEAQALSVIKSVLTKEENDMCAVNLVWELPPNFGEDDVSHFTVTVNDEKNVTSTSHNYIMCDCEPHNVTITLTDRCGREESTTSIITLNTSQPLFECGIANTTAPFEGRRTDPLTVFFIVAFVVVLVIALVLILIIITLGYILWNLKRNVNRLSVGSDTPPYKRFTNQPSEDGDIKKVDLTFPTEHPDGATKKDNPTSPSGKKDSATKNDNPASPSGKEDGATKKDDPTSPSGKQGGATKKDDPTSPPGKKDGAAKKNIPNSISVKKDGATKKNDPTSPSVKKGGATKTKDDPTSSPKEQDGDTKKEDPTPPPGKLDIKLKKLFESHPTEQEHNNNKSSDLPTIKRRATWIND